jgi:uncharacterized membrane protein
MTLARWPSLVFGLMDATWFLCGILCAALAAAFVLRKDAILQMEAMTDRLEGTHGRRLLAAGLFFPALLALGNLARFRIYYLTADSAIAANLAWNVAHGFGLRSEILGDLSYFTVHFAFTVGLFAPFLWIWNSTGVLAVAHGFLLGLVPPTLFALAKRQSDSKLVPWLIFLLALAHPSFQELAGTVLDNSLYALPCFAAAAYFFETDRAALGTLFVLLMFSTREEVPFVSFGIGLYLVFRRLRPRRRAGTALMAASVLIWLAEMKIITWARHGASNYDAWNYFNEFGGSQEAVAAHALARPWDFVIALFSPPAKLLPVSRVLSHTAFLPFFAGAAFLPALFVWIPHQLAPLGTDFQGLRGHYSSFVLGPLLWATLKGLISLYKRCAPDHRRSLIAILLLVASWGFLTAPGFFAPEVHVIPKAWETAAPKALERIPPDAAVWCDAFLAPHLAMRRYIKILPRAPREFGFENDLFLPDYVLLSEYWARINAPASGRILDFLRERGFEPIFRDADLVILADPKRNRAGGAEPERIKL